jgi:tRNA modification GTPase
LEVASRADVNPDAKRAAVYTVSAVTGFGLDRLVDGLIEQARRLLPRPGDSVLNARQSSALAEAYEILSEVGESYDLLVVAERLRLSRLALDRLLGRHSTEDMLDALFGRFCIGK